MRATWFSFLPSVTAPGRRATCSHCCPASCALPFVCHMVWPLAHSALRCVWRSCQWADCTLKCLGHLGNNTSSCSRSFLRSFSNRCCCASPKPAMASWPLRRSWSMACCASSACAMRWLSLYFSKPSSEKGSSSSAASSGWSRRRRKRSTKNTSTGWRSKRCKCCRVSSAGAVSFGVASFDAVAADDAEDDNNARCQSSA